MQTFSIRGQEFKKIKHFKIKLSPKYCLIIKSIVILRRKIGFLKSIATKYIIITAICFHP